MILRRAGMATALLVAAAVIAVVALQARSPGAVVPASATPAVGPGSAAAHSTHSLAPSAGASSSPESGGIGLKHVWLIVMENRSYASVLGSGHAPYLDSLAAHYGVATDYHAVARPSEPNYLALVSGSTQGVRDDAIHDITAPTIFDQLEAADRGWAVYAENVPLGCYTGATASDGPDGPGTYARKHEPAISFTAISGSPTRCVRIANLSAFAPGGADFSLIVPNLCHDMHDCSTAAGDAWLRGFVPRITRSAEFADAGLLVITFDEAQGSDGSQRVPLVFAGPGIAAGTRAAAPATHYSLLRTIQDGFGLGCLAESCSAQPIPELVGQRP